MFPSLFCQKASWKHQITTSYFSQKKIRGPGSKTYCHQNVMSCGNNEDPGSGDRIPNETTLNKDHFWKWTKLSLPCRLVLPTWKIGPVYFLLIIYSCLCYFSHYQTPVKSNLMKSYYFDWPFEVMAHCGCCGMVTGALRVSWSHCMCILETGRWHWSCWLLYRTGSATFKEGVQLTISGNILWNKPWNMSTMWF